MRQILREGARTLIETAKEDGRDLYRYLTWILSEAPKRASTDFDWVASPLPQNAPLQCRGDSNLMPSFTIEPVLQRALFHALLTFAKEIQHLVVSKREKNKLL